MAFIVSERYIYMFVKVWSLQVLGYEYRDGYRTLYMPILGINMTKLQENHSITLIFFLALSP